MLLYKKFEDEQNFSARLVVIADTWEEPKRKAGPLTLFVALLEQIIPSKGFHFGKSFLAKKLLW